MDYIPARAKQSIIILAGFYFKIIIFITIDRIKKKDILSRCCGVGIGLKTAPCVSGAREMACFMLTPDYVRKS
jgi:hypothetical protein